MSDLETEVEKKENEITTLNENLASAHSQISDFEKEKANFISEIEEKNNKIKTLEDDIAGSKETISTME